MRIIHACREMGIIPVAVYSEADATAAHVRLADEAYPVGPAPAAQSYLNADRLIAVACEAGCDSIHPGYGFLSEAPDFAQQVIDAGLIWVGPQPDTIRRMGVKTEARALMQAAGVPVVPGFQPDDPNAVENSTFAAEADRIGYPVMVKAAGGGGGKGIRIVRDPADLIDALESARREARNAFGDPRVFLEKYIESGRHIEVQVIADTQGHVLHLFERECSVQRRHQKIMEETPSPLVDDAMRAAITQAAVDAARAVDYVNAGTVEFIATVDGDFYFLEMNTRLQVEHPITEQVTGVDLVRWQLAVAAGEPLPVQQVGLRQTGHAIECRVYAEDPHNDFLPATGTVQRFVPPRMPGVRVDAGLQSGDAVTIHYDPMIAKIIAYGRTRAEAIARMRHALRETVILGTTTNIDFLLALLDDPAFEAGAVDTAYVDRNLHALLPQKPPVPSAALIALALADMDALGAAESPGSAGTGDRYSPWARGDGFRMTGGG
ncbi:MAG: acetyl-CoA carboxylase biotin carboxylase subunit [Chloroflexota bacterium]